MPIAPYIGQCNKAALKMYLKDLEGNAIKTALYYYYLSQIVYKMYLITHKTGRKVVSL